MSQKTLDKLTNEIERLHEELSIAREANNTLDSCNRLV